MSKATTTLPKRKGRSTLDDKLDAHLAVREKVEAKIARANAKRAKRLAKVEKKYQQDLGRAALKLERIDAGLAGFVERHLYWMTRRHSKTVVRDLGEIKVVRRAIEMEFPADESPIVDFLLKRPGGKEYLVQTWKLDKRKLLQAPSKLYAELRKRGVWRGRHQTISVKSPSSAKTKEISRKRFNDRTP